MPAPVRLGTSKRPLNLYASALTIDFVDIAAVQGIPDKNVPHVLVTRRSVIPHCEDLVTLVVNAVKPIVDVARLNQQQVRLLCGEA